MPYRGSIIDVADENDSGLLHEWHWGGYGFAHVQYLESSLRDERMCDFPGIYFRRFVWAGSPPCTTLRVAIWYPILLSAALPILWIFQHGPKAIKFNGLKLCRYQVF
jgi:hypothetical protein